MVKIIFYPLSKACNNMEKRFPLLPPVCPCNAFIYQEQVLRHKTVKAPVAAVNTKILAVVRTPKLG